MIPKLSKIIAIGLMYATLVSSLSYLKPDQARDVWWMKESPERGTRHLEWFSSSSDRAEIAKPSEKSLLDNLFGDEDDDDTNESEDNTESNDKDDNDNEDDDDVDEKDLTPEELKQRIYRKHAAFHHIIFPLLIAYKLKFYTMVPVLIGTIVLLVGTTGMAGFFFALFAAAAGLGGSNHSAFQ